MSRASSYPVTVSAAVSAVMRGNRWRDTRPEVRLRSVLHAKGHRFRVNLKVEIPGLRVRPDIVFSRCRLAVFVDGCFWHSCRHHGTLPRVNTAYWLPKLERVAKRDRRVRNLLSAAGWTVVRIWEHTPLEEAADIIQAAIQEKCQSVLSR
jgi:DNA mismatch endonuclease (patch repair protein)